MRLTDTSVRALPAPPKGAKIHHDESLTGFGVRVTSTGVKSFVLTYGAQRERVTIGRYPIISLADARQIAKEKLAEITLGKHRPKRMTFGAAMELYLKEKQAKNKASTLSITRGILNTHFKHLHGKALQDLRMEDVTVVSDSLLRAGYPSAASHATVAIKTFVRWCSRRGYILGNIQADNIERPYKALARERVLTDDELRTLWKALQSTPEPFASIVKLLLLTGQRRSEVASLQSDWIKDNTICLPAQITKNKRAHTIPLSAHAIAVLAPLISTQSTLLFSAKGSKTRSFSGWSKSKAALDKLAKIDDWRLHDCRRSYATNLQRLGVQPQVIEALLNHLSGQTTLTRTYQRHTYWNEMCEAVRLYDDWFTTNIASPA